MEQETRYFQFLQGDRRGQVVIYDKDVVEEDITYIVFKDNSRVNKDMVLPLNQINVQDKYVAEVSNTANIWKFNERWVGREEERWSKPEDSPSGERFCIQEFVPGRKVIDFVPPMPTMPKSSRVSENTSTAAQNTTPINKIDIGDPVNIMLNKSKKIDTEINMDLTIALPSKELYNIIKENFEDGDIKILEYIINNLNIDEIKTSLKTGLKNMYENE